MIMAAQLKTNPSLVLEIGHLGAGSLLRVPDSAAIHQLNSETLIVDLLLETLEVNVKTGTITIVELQIIVGQLGKDPIQDQLAIPAYQSDLIIKPRLNSVNSPILLFGDLQWSSRPFFIGKSVSLVLPHLSLLKTFNHDLASIGNSKVVV